MPTVIEPGCKKRSRILSKGDQLQMKRKTNGQSSATTTTDVNVVTWQLFDLDQVPAVFHEIGIKTGYRNPCSTPLECLRSAFKYHNETVNFWTHFLPTWYFVWTMNNLCTSEFLYDTYNWPFLAYLVTVCIMPLVSSAAHLFAVMSENARHICFFADYSSICWYGFGAGVAYQAYCFDDSYYAQRSLYRTMYLPIVGGFSVFSTLIACWSRFVKNVKRKKLMRLFAFGLPYGSSIYPLILRLINCYETDDWSDAGSSLHAKHFLYAFTSILIYALHLPECLAPGQFDIVGHSHQIFHVIGMFATYMQVWGCYTDSQTRRSKLESLRVARYGWADAFFVSLVFVCNLSILVHFSYRLINRLSKPTLSAVSLGKMIRAEEDGDDDEEEETEKSSATNCRSTELCRPEQQQHGFGLKNLHNRKLSNQDLMIPEMQFVSSPLKIDA